MIYYESSTGWFYDTNLFTGAVPSGVVEISKETHLSLIMGESIGQVISSSEDGIPFLEPRPQPTVDELIARNLVVKNSLVAEGMNTIYPLQYAADLGIITEEESARYIMWKEYIVELGRVDLTKQNVQWPTEPRPL